MPPSHSIRTVSLVLRRASVGVRRRPRRAPRGAAPDAVRRLHPRAARRARPHRPPDPTHRLSAPRWTGSPREGHRRSCRPYERESRLIGATTVNRLAWARVERSRQSLIPSNPRHPQVWRPTLVPSLSRRFWRFRRQVILLDVCRTTSLPRRGTSVVAAATMHRAADRSRGSSHPSRGRSQRRPRRTPAGVGWRTSAAQPSAATQSRTAMRCWSRAGGQPISGRPRATAARACRPARRWPQPDLHRRQRPVPDAGAATREHRDHVGDVVEDEEPAVPPGAQRIRPWCVCHSRRPAASVRWNSSGMSSMRAAARSSERRRLSCSR